MMQELNYIRCGDYYIPDIRLPKETRPIGRWGRMHRDYIKEHNPIRFNDLCLSGEVWTYLADLNEQAQSRLELIIEQMKASEGVTEGMKQHNQKYYPILIEYKGYKDKLVKLDAEGNVANRNAKNQPDYTNINSYAVNGAVHYSNAVLHYTSYTDVIAIGVTGYKDASGKLKHLIGVYYVAKSNFGVGQKVDEYTDLSFLKKEHFSAFIEKVKQLSLPQDEIEKLKERREQEITA